MENYQNQYTKKVHRIKILEKHTAPMVNIFLTMYNHVNGRWYQRKEGKGRKKKGSFRQYGTDLEQ